MRIMCLVCLASLVLTGTSEAGCPAAVRAALVQAQSGSYVAPQRAEQIAAPIQQAPAYYTAPQVAVQQLTVPAPTYAAPLAFTAPAVPLGIARPLFLPPARVVVPRRFFR